jgi:uncharacterized secreted repeat protein (TIGR03808 family)
MVKRRTVLQFFSMASLPVITATATSLSAQTAPIRQSIDTENLTLNSKSPSDQSVVFSKILAQASENNEVVNLPAGDYYVSNILLPKRTRLRGVPGATRLIYSGSGSFFRALNSEIIDLNGIICDGGDQNLSDEITALLEFDTIPQLMICQCVITRSPKNAINLKNCAGHIEKSVISYADIALYSLDGAGVTISDNTIYDCKNGGILVHTSTLNPDKTIIRYNRVNRISAFSGGTGQYGNGINVFRAGDIIISNNQIADCAFSSIRCNSASNSQIIGNTCLRSGETGIYAEFSFESVIIANNIVDGATDGISVANFNEGGRLAIISGNIVRNMKENGPYPAEMIEFGNGISAEADTVITGNIIENIPKIGILLGWGSYMRNLSVTGNIVRNANEGIGISVVEGVGKAVMSANIFDNIKTGMIFGRQWKKVVTKDMITFGSQGYENITINK